MTQEDYRAHAAECLALANKSSDRTIKLTLVNMARAWVGLAQLAENNAHTDIVYETPERDFEKH